MSKLPALKIAGYCLCLLLCSCAEFFGTSSALHLKKAEEFSRRQEYDKAIAEYELHIKYRLALRHRPEWENPYFYLILIGDLQLLEGKPEQALGSYCEAEQDGIDSNLVSDRYRSLAHWYEQNGELEKASAILKQRRDTDPILFDSMLDRLSKEIVQKEEEEKSIRK